MTQWPVQASNNRFGKSALTRTSIAAFVLFAACACSGDTGQPLNGPLSESLTFTGDVAGHMTMGLDALSQADINPMPALTQNPEGKFVAPPPTHTQCASFKIDPLPANDFLGVESGAIDGKRFTLTIEISEDSVAYTSPGQPLKHGNTNQGGSVGLHAVTDARDWQQVIGPKGEDPAVIIMNPDRRSGNVDAWLADSQYSQKQTDATIHVTGTWRCG